MFSIKKRIDKYKQKCKKRNEMKKQKAFSESLLSCGNNPLVFGEPVIFSPDRLSVGNNFRINHDVFINARGTITIGDDVTLSTGCKIVSTGYDIEHWMNTGEKKHIDNAPVYIGNHCWVGAGAIILPGVNISGEYVVIGAGAVVTKDITESRVLVAGNPAKIVKRYNDNNQE